MPRYDVFLEGRAESSTCYFGVAVMADDQKEAEYLGHEALCKLKECKRKYDTPFNRETQEVHSNIEEEIADVFIMLVQLFAIFNPHELVNITKVVWDKLDRLKDNLDKEAAKQEASDAGKK